MNLLRNENHILLMLKFVRQMFPMTVIKLESFSKALELVNYILLKIKYLELGNGGLE